MIQITVLPNHFQISHASFGWWEKEPYWFTLAGSKVKVNFSTLCIKPFGHDTDYSFCPITLKLHMHVWGWWENEPYWFWVIGSKVNCGTLLVKPLGHDTGYTASFCPITSYVSCWWWEQRPFSFGHMVLFRSQPWPPARGCHALHCIV